MKATEFCAAVKVGDIALVQQMVQTSPQLVHNACEESIGLPLHTAVLNRDAAMTRLLMESGADARFGIWPHRDATTAHIIACDRGYDDVLLAIEESERSRRRAASVPNAPIDLRSDQINRAILQDHCDDAIAILQSDLSLVGACNIGQPINGIDCRRLPDGATPLHAAAWKHNTRMVRWLIQHGACVDAQDCTGQTPLDYAATMAAGVCSRSQSRSTASKWWPCCWIWDLTRTSQTSTVTRNRSPACRSGLPQCAVDTTLPNC